MLRLAGNELGALPRAPFDTGPGLDLALYNFLPVLFTAVGDRIDVMSLLWNASIGSCSRAGPFCRRRASLAPPPAGRSGSRAAFDQPYDRRCSA